MTTREFTPRLDRQITREVTSTVEVPASAVYTYDALYVGGGDNLDPGTWRRESDTELILALADSGGGLSFPQDLVLPLDGVGVSWDGAAASILTITALVIVRAGFTFQPISLRVTFGSALPAAGAALAITVQTGGTQTVTQTTQRPVWAARRDFLGRDLVTAIAGSLVTIGDTRFIVRAEGPAWDEGDTFIDDEGVTRTVRGVAQIGRSRYLELLARFIG